MSAWGTSIGMACKNSATQIMAQPGIHDYMAQRMQEMEVGGNEDQMFSYLEGFRDGASKLLALIMSGDCRVQMTKQKISDLVSEEGGD